MFSAARSIPDLRLKIIGLLALTAAAFIAMPALAADKLKVGKAVPGVFSFAPLDVGIEKGIFQKYGIDATGIDFGGSSKLHQALASGAIDIGLGSGPGMVFMAKGSTARAVAAMAGPPLLLTLFVRNDVGINTVKDLKGKRISCSTVSGLTYWLIKEISRQEGWGPNGIKATPLGRPSGQVAALLQKQIDGMVTEIGVAYKLHSQNKGKILIRFGERIKPFHIHVIYATKKMMDTNPDAITRFLKGWFETIAFMHKNKAETVRITRRVTKQTEAIANSVYDEVMPMFSLDGKFDDAAVERLQGSYVELGLVKKVPPKSVMYTEKYLPKM